MVVTKDYTLHNRADYFKKLIGDINATKKGAHIAVATMSFDPRGPLIKKLVTALAAAAKRNAKVTFLVDAEIFLLRNPFKPGPIMPGPLFLRKRIPTNLPERQRICYQSIQKLESAGVSCRITNLPKHRLSIPQSGRSHIKAAVVDNIVYIGGCNLSKPNEIDVMVRLKSAQAAKSVYTWLLLIAEVGSTRRAFQDVDTDYTLNNGDRLLVDAGVPKQSIIYEEAINLIDTSKEWLLLTCQFFPGGTTAQHLAAAQARGVNVSIIYSNLDTHGAQSPFHHLYSLRERIRLPASLFTGQLAKEMPNLHAKVLLSEKAAMVGSHNFVTQGVTLGTGEIALLRKDPTFTSDLRDFIEAQVSYLK